MRLLHQYDLYTMRNIAWLFTACGLILMVHGNCWKKSERDSSRGLNLQFNLERIDVGHLQT